LVQAFVFTFCFCTYSSLVIRMAVDTKDILASHPAQCPGPMLLGRLHHRTTKTPENHMRKCDGRKCWPDQRQRTRELGDLALRGLGGVITWTPMVLLPIELAQLAMVTTTLRTAVKDICSHLLRHACDLFRPRDGIGLCTSERALHRVWRFASLKHCTCSAAENYTAAIDMHGSLIVWGRPGWLESRYMEHPPKEWPPLPPTEAVLSPTHFPNKRPVIVSVAASRHTVLALTKDGKVLFTQVQRDAHNAVKQVDLIPLRDLDSVKVIHVSTRFGQAFAISHSGCVYAWGLKSGDPLQPLLACSMGLGDIATLVSPVQIPSFGPAICTPIHSVAVGVSHTVFVSCFGEVFTVGRNDNSKLGLGHSAAQLEQIMVPQKVLFPPRRVRPFIIAAAAGASHSIFLSNNGQAWGCGLSDALPTTRTSAKFTVAWNPQVLDLLPCFCSGVAAGISCSFFVSDCGGVYFSGKARQSNQPFGRPSKNNSCMPWRIQGLRDIMAVSVSMELSEFKWEHAIFTHRDGLLSGWGHAAHGELPCDPTSGVEDAGFRNDIVSFKVHASTAA